jgi:hypothetical protein
VLGPSLPGNRWPYFSLPEPCYDYAIFDVEIQSVFRVGMPLSIRYCRAIAACAPSYDLIAPPTLHPTAPTFCSYGGFCFVQVCGAPGCVHPAGVCVISYASSPPRRYTPAASLHHGRGVSLRRSSPAPHTRAVFFSRCANTIGTALATVTVLFEFIVFFDVLV